MKPTKITNAKILKQGFVESDQFLYRIEVDVKFDLGSQKTTIAFLKKEEKWVFVRGSRYVGGVPNHLFKEQFEIIKKELMDHPSIKLKLLFAKQEIGVLV